MNRRSWRAALLLIFPIVGAVFLVWYRAHDDSPTPAVLESAKPVKVDEQTPGDTFSGKPRKDQPQSPNGTSIAPLSFEDREAEFKKALEPLLERMFFAHEDSSWQVFYAGNNTDIRRKALKSVLSSPLDPAAVTAVVEIVAENADKIASIPRVYRAVMSLVGENTANADLLNSKELVGRLLGHVKNRSLGEDVRVLATGLLGIHTGGFFSNRGAVLNDPACQTEDIQRLNEDFAYARSTKENKLAGSLLEVIAAYSRTSPLARESLIQLCSQPPKNAQVRDRLLRMLVIQQWPIFQEQPAFDFVIGSISPDDLHSLELASTAVGALGSQKAHDPRIDQYVEKLAWAFGQIDETSEEGQLAREEIVHNFVFRDNRQVVPSIESYLRSKKVSMDSKRDVLTSLLREAKGEGLSGHGYEASSSEMYSMLKSLSGDYQISEDLADLVNQCQGAFLKIVNSR